MQHVTALHTTLKEPLLTPRHDARRLPTKVRVQLRNTHCRMQPQASDISLAKHFFGMFWRTAARAAAAEAAEGCCAQKRARYFADSVTGATRSVAVGGCELEDADRGLSSLARFSLTLFVKRCKGAPQSAGDGWRCAGTRAKVCVCRLWHQRRRAAAGGALMGIGPMPHFSAAGPCLLSHRVVCRLRHYYAPAVVRALQVVATSLASSPLLPSVSFVTHEAHRPLLMGPLQSANVELRTVRRVTRLVPIAPWEDSTASLADANSRRAMNAVNAQVAPGGELGSRRGSCQRSRRIKRGFTGALSTCGEACTQPTVPSKWTDVVCGC